MVVLGLALQLCVVISVVLCGSLHLLPREVSLRREE